MLSASVRENTNRALGPEVALQLHHLTFYKCGSQWVRDLLTDPRMVSYSGYRMAATGVDLQNSRWPRLRPGEIATPLYSAGLGDWRKEAGAKDRAWVVLRDPRDIVVSLVYSVAISHTPTPVTWLVRGPLEGARPEERMQLGMYLLAQWAAQLRSWSGGSRDQNVLITRYESLLADLGGEIGRLCTFLGWPVPEATIQAIAADHQFSARSGRAAGEENEFSHRRKGIAGDWRNHFNRRLGQVFEEAFPGMLAELGYERDGRWWEGLKEGLAPQREEKDEERKRLLAVLTEHEVELVKVRQAAEERLRDVEVLHQALRAAEVRAREMETAAGERMRVIEELEARKRELEGSVSWRFGFVPLRKLLSLLPR